MFEFSVTSSKILWLLAAIFLLYGVFYLYRSLKSDFYSSQVKVTLVILRSFAILIFILLLLDLSVEHHRFSKYQPKLAFLWDMSQSMSADSAYSQNKILRSDLYRNLNKTADIAHISNMAVPEIYSLGQIRRMDRKETLSDNSVLIRFAEKAAPYDELFLVTDGQSWLGEDLSSLKINNNINLNVIAVGKKAESALPEIRSLRYPGYISQGDSVDVKYEIYNPSEKSVKFELEVLADKSISKSVYELSAFRSVGITQKIAFENIGNNLLKWRYNDTDNNVLLHEEIITVKAATLNLVFYADPPDRDIAMLKFVLDDIDRYNCYHYKEWNEEHPQETPDVFITNSSSFLVPELEIAPTLIFYRNKNREYISSEDFKIKSYRSWLMIYADPFENMRNWSQLPPVKLVSQAPAGKVLLEDSNAHPVIVDVGGALQVNAEGLWKWNLAAFNKDWDGLYEDLFIGMIEELIGTKSAKTLSFNENEYNTFAFRPLGFNLDLADDLSQDYKLIVSLRDSNRSEQKRIETSDASKTLYLKIDEAGEYSLSASLFVNGEILAEDSAKVSILLNDLERTRLGLNEIDLKKLCTNNRGRYISSGSLDTFVYDLKRNDKETMLSRTYTFRDQYYLYLLLFLLLVADWVIRKMNGGI